MAEAICCILRATYF